MARTPASSQSGDGRRASRTIGSISGVPRVNGWLTEGPFSGPAPLPAPAGERHLFRGALQTARRRRFCPTVLLAGPQGRQCASNRRHRFRPAARERTAANGATAAELVQWRRRWTERAGLVRREFRRAASFPEREAAALALSNEATRLFLRDDLVAIADRYGEEVEVDGRLYKAARAGDGEVLHVVRRPRYRTMDVP